MTHDEFKKAALATMAKFGATGREVFTDREHTTERTEGDRRVVIRERIFGMLCTYRGEKYELSMVHGKWDESSMKMALHALERMPKDVDELHGRRRST